MARCQCQWPLRWSVPLAVSRCTLLFGSAGKAADSVHAGSSGCWGRRHWQGARPTTCHCVHKQALADAQGPARGLCMSPRRWQLRKWPATRSCVEG